MEDKKHPRGQCHGCWWPGDTKSHGITSHNINLVCVQFVYRLYTMRIHFSSTGPKHIYDLNLVITEPADGLASAGTVMTI